MKVAALVSGGKDSTLAAGVALQHGWEVTHAVTVQPRASDSWMFHAPNTDLGPLLAQALGAAYVPVETAGEAESEVDDLARALAGLEIDGFVSGAVASEYQRTRLERIGHRLGLRSFAPLWHKRPEEILATVTAEGWDVRVAAVAAEGLDATWLGRRLDAAAAQDLQRLHERYGVHVGGEGGEYESLTLEAPFFAHRIEVLEAEGRWARDHGVWRVGRARLASRSNLRTPGEPF